MSVGRFWSGLHQLGKVIGHIKAGTTPSNVLSLANLLATRVVALMLVHLFVPDAMLKVCGLIQLNRLALANFDACDNSIREGLFIDPF